MKKMALFGNYESSGAGIAKNAPKKKPFFRYWELVFRKFWKLIEVNLLMMLSFLPIALAAVLLITIGAAHYQLALILDALLLIVFAVNFGPSIAACTQILRNFAREKPCFLLDTYFKTYKGSFKQALLLGLIDIVVALSSASAFYVYPLMIQAGASSAVYVLLVLTLSMALAVLMMSFYGYLMIVSTELSMKNVLKNSLALSIIALKKNIITLLLAVLVISIFAVLTYYYPLFVFPFLFFVPIAFVAFMIVFNCYPVIQKFVINPYYSQKGEVSPEVSYTQTEGENLFEDQGGKEKTIEAPKSSKGTEKKRKKGKVVS